MPSSDFPSRPSEQTVNSDLETVYAYTCLELPTRPSSVFLYGRSLGTSPSTHLASVLTCGSPALCIAKLSCEKVVRYFEAIRKRAWVTEGEQAEEAVEEATTMLGGLILQSPMKSCLKTRIDLGLDFTSKTGDCDGER